MSVVKSESWRGVLPVPTGGDVVRTAVLAMGLMVAVLVAGMLGLNAAFGKDWTFLGIPLGAVAGVVGVWLALVRGNGWSWAEIGFRPFEKTPLHLGWQIPASILLGAMGTAGIAKVLGMGTDAADRSSNELSLIADNAFRPLFVALLVVSTAVLTPAVEEVVFRRMLFGWISGKVSLKVAVPLAAIVFGSIHVIPAVVIYASFLGLFTTLLYVRYRTLWAPLALHAVNNALVTWIALS